MQKSNPCLTVGTGCRSAPEVESLLSVPKSNQSKTTVRMTSGGESDFLLFRLSKAVDLADKSVDKSSRLHPFDTELCRSPWMFFVFCFFVRTVCGWCLWDFQLCIWTQFLERLPIFKLFEWWIVKNVWCFSDGLLTIMTVCIYSKHIFNLMHANNAFMHHNI